jgi:hypothetical protein
MSARDMPIINVRLPHELNARFKAALAARKLTVTEAAREAVTQWIDGPLPRLSDGTRDPRDRSPAACESCGRPVEADRLCYARPTCHACLPPPPPLPVVPTNPLRALREAAGLTQRQAADACGIARRTWQIAEAAATAAPAMVARARKAMVRK